LAEALPFEGHARVEGRLLDVLDLAEHLDQLAARTGAHRRQAERAVADDDAGHAVLEAGRRQAIPAQLRSEVSMYVNEAGAQQVAPRVDFLFGAAVELPDCGNLAVIDRDIASEPRRAGSINDSCISNREFSLTHFLFL